MGQLTMTKDEREAFLADVHVAVLAVNGDGVPSLTPIWYSYERGGDVLINTAGDSPKTALLPSPSSSVDGEAQASSEPSTSVRYAQLRAIAER